MAACVILNIPASTYKITNMRYLLTACLCSLFVLFAFRSPVAFVVSGKVTDDKGDPIPAVSILIKGTTTGTITLMDGSFKITVSRESAILVFATVGFDNKEVAVSPANANIEVKLIQSKRHLQEVVVIGYGTKGRRGSISTKPRPAPKTFYKNGYPTSGRKMQLPDKKDKDSEDDGFSREGYDAIVENRFLEASKNPLSTFSIDVDAASYSNVRRILESGQLPPAGAVRIEEMINYFSYEYPQPQSEVPFSFTSEMSECPWNKEHKLILIGLQGRKIDMEALPASNIVFLVDVSGSMNYGNKLPLVKQSLNLLTDQLRSQDKVAIVVYAGNAGLVLPSTSGEDKKLIKQAIDNLEAGGSTAGGKGIKLAYQVAKEQFIDEGNNRVILCTDGDFNVGISSDDALEDLIEEERESGVYLTVLGYGMGNYQDAKMQKLADKGNGNHAYIDNFMEARKVLVNEFAGTLFTIAKDVKLQIEFNPALVQGYRLVGYENRLMNKEDFNNDKKDAGDLGSGHSVTALYEIIPVGVKSNFIETIDPLKYQPAAKVTTSFGNELMTIKFRYKNPGGLKSKLLVHSVNNNQLLLAQTSSNFRFAASVAAFGMLLRKSEFLGNATYKQTFDLANAARGADKEGYRQEFLLLVKTAQDLEAIKDVNTKKDTGKN